MLNYTFLMLGLLYTLFIPGFTLVEYLIPKAKFYIRLPLYFVISTLFSTYFSFITAYFFGFNRLNVIFDLLVFLIPFIFIFYKRIVIIIREIQNEKSLILSGLVVFLLFFVSLNQGIFREYQDNFIMSGPNWQDTAMHLSIIESISEGNFPPQASYFSGEPLNYYYFADLHAAINNTMYGGFFPYILVILNPFLAMTTFFVVYALARLLIKSNLYATIAGFLSVLYGNLGFVNLIKDIIEKKENYLSLVTNSAYHLNHETTLLMVPLSDYFLQNRPMMVGLPVFVTVCLLLFLHDKNKKTEFLILAGVINGLLIKFQFFGFLIGLLFFGCFIFYNLISKKENLKTILKNGCIFVLPSVVLILIFGFGKVGTRSLFEVVTETFSFDGLFKKGLNWNLSFIVTNFNLPIFIFLLSPFFLRSIKKLYFSFLFLFTLILLAVPFVIKFTIYDYDMFKFFYYTVPLLVVVVMFVFKHISQKNKIYVYLVFIVTVFTSLTSFNMLLHSYLNRSVAYSMSDYQAGLWIRQNTPKDAVFITYPSVHNGASDIAGRVRVLSYINWPYSHGFNTGTDNVFSRVDDINSFYNNPDRIDILDKYNVNYIYFSGEERSNFPESENKLESVEFLEKIYDEKDIKIFRRKI